MKDTIIYVILIIAAIVIVYVSTAIFIDLLPPIKVHLV